ncbi:histone-lysine N-methyltransferase SETMAR-like [Octopus sinensis]|uniref:Histone-lysine N-methyltransferase SETMAR-like n=1 Tax=Octopus sinensis TaxID=2607531 RepID=A0A6P7TR21_9MOLL|nr:histone-lysine N-methyltransferase SETMAR-like [Octopus sinensis]
MVTLRQRHDTTQIIKIKCQVDQTEHFQHHLLFAFNRSADSAIAAREICAMYGEGTAPQITDRHRFSCFKNANFVLSDGSHTGRPTESVEERLNELLQENPRQTTRELAEQMDYDKKKKTVVDHLHSMGKLHRNRLVDQCVIYP